jgi:hypothetical protein
MVGRKSAAPSAVCMRSTNRDDDIAVHATVLRMRHKVHLKIHTAEGAALFRPTLAIVKYINVFRFFE